MCGLAGIVLKDGTRWNNEHEAALDRALTSIAGRGRDATGIAAIRSDGRIMIEKGAASAHTFARERRTLPSDTRMVIGHTRAATQGHPCFARNNHPIELGHIVLAHNGWLYNEDKLRAAAKAVGVRGRAEVDTEAMVVALKAQGKATALRTFEGAASFTWFDSLARCLYLATFTPTTTPLYVVESHRAITWSSYRTTAEALQPIRLSKRDRKRGRFLQAGEGIAIPLEQRRPRPFAFTPTVTTWKGWTSTDARGDGWEIKSDGRSISFSHRRDSLCEWCDENEATSRWQGWRLCEDCAIQLAEDEILGRS